MKAAIDFPGYSLMSVDEKICFMLMEKLNGDSLWLTAVKNVCREPNVYRFRKLICELKSQAADNAEVMRNIVGEEILNYIIKL